MQAAAVPGRDSLCDGVAVCIHCRFTSRIVQSHKRSDHHHHVEHLHHHPPKAVPPVVCLRIDADWVSVWLQGIGMYAIGML